jgi:alkylated DNA nucleotide flippase Atl1
MVVLTLLDLSERLLLTDTLYYSPRPLTREGHDRKEKAMTITLTIEAETSEELNEQIEHFLGPDRVPLDQPAASSDKAEGSPPPTNDDYRRAIESIPGGKVAAYSVVSEVVRDDADGSQHVAGLAANDGSLRAAYRVVKKDRSIAAGFRFTDGRKGGPDEARELLQKEGVRFDVHGRVLREFMLTAAELRVHYEAETPGDE